MPRPAAQEAQEAQEAHQGTRRGQCATPDRRHALTMALLASPPDHGTRRRYVAQRCRCAHCRRANASYEASRPRRADHLVPAAAARAHLHALVERGASLRALARHCGVGRSTLERILHGTAPTVRSATADAVLGLPSPEQAPLPGAYVPADTARSLLDAFARSGYSPAQLAARVGRPVRLRGERISARSFAALAEAARRAGAEISPSGAVLADPMPAELLEWVEHWQQDLRVSKAQSSALQARRPRTVTSTS